jgi:hypothetical protein
MRPQRQNGTEGRAASLNGTLTPLSTLPVYSGILTRLVGETRETWEAGCALWGSAKRQPPESPERTPGNDEAGKGRGRKRTPHGQGVDRGARAALRGTGADVPRV